MLLTIKEKCIFVSILAICLFALSACTSKNQVLEGGTYTLQLPSGYELNTDDNFPDGTICSGQAVVGGISCGTFEDADQLAASLGLPQNQALDDFLRGYVLAPDETADAYLFSASVYGDFQLWPKTGQRSQTHYFFPSGDQVYDIWFQENALDIQDEEMILSSFTLSHL